jgi:predicted methyltransferase
METLRLPIHVVDYEQMVSDPVSTLDGLRAFLGLSVEGGAKSGPDATSSIASASMWQARQPIYHRSVGRWGRYAEYLPELVELF